VTKWNVRPEAKHYGFMLRVAGPDDLEVIWKRIKGTGSWEASCDVVDSGGNRLEDFTAAVAPIQNGSARTALRVGVAAGPWQTLSSHNGHGMMGVNGETGIVLWSQAFEDSGDTCIVATAQWRFRGQERIVATDLDGVTHTAPGGSVSSGDLDLMTTRFARLKPNQVKEFQYQVRPYDWVEFDNVSLQPGKKTDVHARAVTASGLDVRSGVPDSEALKARIESAKRLCALGKALLVYANDHDDRLPNRLEDLDNTYDRLDMPWLLKNVTYLGKGVILADDPDRMLAYDKTLPKAGGTNALFLDSHVEFVVRDRLPKPNRPAP